MGARERREPPEHEPAQERNSHVGRRGNEVTELVPHGHVAKIEIAFCNRAKANPGILIQRILYGQDLNRSPNPRR